MLSSSLPILHHSLPRQQISFYVLIVLAGTFWRIIWANEAQPWLTSIDNLAWVALLNDPSHEMRLDRLIHYPHETGGSVYSLLALLLPTQLGGWPALNVVTLFLESGMRLGMILCAHVIFGRRIALLFGIWTVAATPLIVEWSIIPHGMHANAAIWPFLGLLLIHKKAQFDIRLIGLLSAMSLYWSFDNLPLVLWVLCYLVWQKTPLKLLLRWFITLILGLLPLMLLQVFGDLGFDMMRTKTLWIRGIDFNPLLGVSKLANLIMVWIKPIPGSSLLPILWLRGIWALLVYIGITAGLKWDCSRETRWGTAFFIGFIVIYALSPVYQQAIRLENGISYRHLAYIMPLALLLALNGLHKMPGLLGHSIAIALLLLGLWGGWVRFNDSAYRPKIPIDMVGLSLAWKLGHDVPRLTNLINSASFDDKVQIIEGVGSGYAHLLLPSENLTELIDKIDAYPCEYRPALKQGVINTFVEQEPKYLNLNLLIRFRRHYAEVSGTD